MLIARAANQVVRAADAAVPVSSTRGSVKYAVEAIGAFFLLVSTSAAVGSVSPFAPLGIGAILMMMVYAGDHLSGAHHNAVVTLAVLAGRRIALRDAISYWIIQFGVGMLSAVVVRRIVDPAQVTRSAAMTLAGSTLVAAFVVELLFTFALCYVVLNAATRKSYPNTPYFGLAIGFTVLAGAFVIGAMSGGAFNPAVSLGAAAMDMSAWPMLEVYLVAQTFAGIVAGVSFLALNADDRQVGCAGPIPHVDQRNSTDHQEAGV
jgi:aquaporin Z